MWTRFACLLLFAFALPTVHAQCAGSFNRTITGNTSSFAIGANERVRIAPGANFTNAIDSMGTGSELCIDAGATVNSAGIYSSSGTIRNFSGNAVINGINASAGVSVLNTGTLTFNGYFSVSGAITIDNVQSARLVINPYIGLPAGSSLTNSGSLTFGGQFDLNTGAALVNNNRMEVAAAWQPLGTVQNAGFLEGRGAIYMGGTVNNTCWIFTQGAFYNNGTLVNSGVVRAFGSGEWQNNGNFQGTTTSFIIGVNFQNSGPGGVTGYGRYRFTGITNNYTTFAGSSASNPIQFYDVSQTGSQIMDAQSPAPTNTIRPAADPGVLDPSGFTPTNCAPPYTGVTQAHLSITKTNGTTSVAAGSTTNYVITVANQGPGAANGAVLSDPAATGLNCSNAACSVSGGSATCPASVTPAALASGVAINTFPATSSLTFTLTCGVTATGLP